MANLPSQYANRERIEDIQSGAQIQLPPETSLVIEVEGDPQATDIVVEGGQIIATLPDGKVVTIDLPEGVSVEDAPVYFEAAVDDVRGSESAPILDVAALTSQAPARQTISGGETATSLPEPVAELATGEVTTDAPEVSAGETTTGTQDIGGISTAEVGTTDVGALDVGTGVDLGGTEVGGAAEQLVDEGGDLSQQVDAGTGGASSGAGSSNPADTTGGTGSTGTTGGTTSTEDTTPPSAPVISSANASSVSGTAEPGAQIAIDTDGNGTPDYTTTVDADGNWSVDNLNPALSNGDTISVTATDPSGNQSLPSQATIDTQAPGAPTGVDLADASDLGVSNTDNITSDTTPTITGSGGTAGDTVTLYANDGTTQLGTATVDTNGNWSITPTTALADGEHALTASYTDPAGNEGAKSAALNVTIDTTAPQAPTINNTAVGSELSGTAEPDSKVLLTVGDKTYTTTTDAEGNWSVENISPVITNGQTVTAVATDPAGNNSPQTSDNVTVGSGDTTAPYVTLNNTDSGDQLSGTAEPGSTVKLYDASGNPLQDDAGNDIELTADENGEWQTQSGIQPDLTNGAEITAVATDEAGNSGSVTDTISVATGDVEAPQVDINNTDNADRLTGTATPDSTVTLFDSNGDPLLNTAGNPISVTTDAEGNWTTASQGINPDLTNGAQITAVATDAAGNTGSVTETVAVSTGDTTPPDVSINNTPDGNVLTGRAEPGATVELLDDQGQPLLKEAGDPIVLTADDDGNWSTAPGGIAPDLTNGQEVTAVATDAAGNSGSDTKAVAVATGDTTPPENTSIDTPIEEADGKAGINAAEDDTVEITGKADPGSTVEVTFTDSAGNTVGPVATTVDGSGNWTLQSPADLSGLEDGEIKVTAVETDAAGNSAAVTETVNKDATAPQAPNINNTDDPDTLTGTAEPGSTVTVTAGGNTYTVTTDPEGNWTVTDPNLNISTDPNNPTAVTATATDPAGNTSPVTNEDLAVSSGDTTPPNVTINNTDNGDQLTGTTEPGASVKLLDSDGNPLLGSDGNPLPAVTADAEGNWTVTGIEPDLTNGVEITAVATDPAGNSGSVTDTITVSTTSDTTPPVVDINNTDNGDTLSGTATPNSVITLFDDQGNPLKDSAGDAISVTTDAEGNWSVSDINPDLTNGAEITAVATDSAGNSGSVTETIQVATGDTTAPDISINNNSTDGDSLTGQTEPGATVVLYDKDGNPILGSDGQPVDVTVDSEGNWTATGIEPNLTNGQEVTAVATDAAGNAGSVTDTMTVGSGADTTPPENTTITTPIEEADGKPGINALEDSTVEVVGTADVGSTVKVSFIDEAGNSVGPVDATVDGNGNWTLDTPADLTNLDDGTITVKAVETDAAGNSNAVTATVTKDATPPAAPVINNTDDGTKLSGTAEPNSTVVLKDSGGTPLTDADGDVITATTDAEGNWSVSGIDPALQNGDDVKATAIDEAGNPSTETTKTLAVGTGDTSAPDITINNTDDGDKLTGTTEPGATVILYNADGQAITNGDPGDTSLPTVTVDADGNWSVSGLEPDIANNDDITAVATDAAGNTGSATETITVASGNTPPENTSINTPIEEADGLSGINSLEEDDVQIAGKADPGNSVEVTFTDSDGNTVGPVAATVLSTSPGLIVRLKLLRTKGPSS